MKAGHLLFVCYLEKDQNTLISWGLASPRHLSEPLGLILKVM